MVQLLGNFAYDQCCFLICRAKITDLGAEISKLQKEIDSFNQENSTFLTYEKRYVTYRILFSHLLLVHTPVPINTEYQYIKIYSLGG